MTLAGSPPAGQTPLLEQEWDIEVRVRYAPDELSPLPGSTLPDHRSIFNQPAARIVTTWDESLPGVTEPVEVWTVTLRFGRELVLQSAGDTRLRIQTLASVP
jgi:hypothetical protein